MNTWKRFARTGFVLLGIVASVGSCSLLGPTELDGENNTGLWQTSHVVDSTIALSNTDSEVSVGESELSSSSVGATSNATSDRVYFRSSDVEFWEISEIADIEDLHSSKYGVGFGRTEDYASGQSLEYDLGDRVESVVFVPGEDLASVLGAGFNDYWGTRVSRFIDAGNDTINLARFDIGGGYVSFVIDGQIQDTMFTANGTEFNGLNANSIFFVDRQFLSAPVLVDRSAAHDVINGNVGAGGIGISDSDFSLVQTVLAQSNGIDPDTPIDIDGALFIPASPVDLTSFDPATERLALSVSWPIANAVHQRASGYFLDGRVGDTPFNFDLELSVRAGSSVQDNDPTDDAGYGPVTVPDYVNDGSITYSVVEAFWAPNPDPEVDRFDVGIRLRDSADNTWILGYEYRDVRHPYNVSGTAFVGHVGSFLAGDKPDSPYSGQLGVSTSDTQGSTSFASSSASTGAITVSGNVDYSKGSDLFARISWDLQDVAVELVPDGFDGYAFEHAYNRAVAQ